MLCCEHSLGGESISSPSSFLCGLGSSAQRNESEVLSEGRLETGCQNRVSATSTLNPRSS